MADGRVTLGLFISALLVPTALAAQVVRGTITERGSGTPISGVVVALLNERDSVASAGLTNEEGVFEIRAPGPGSYTLDVKRIGVRRTRVGPLVVAQGETVRRDIEIEAVPVAIESMRVTGNSACVQRPAENERTAALWEEARAALTATMLGAQSRTAADSVVRFMRKLDVISWRVLFEQRHHVPASMDRPFRSLPAEDLSRDGYVRPRPDGSADYFAPDAEVLLSTAFLVDHCFRVQQGTNEHAAHIGLVFQPIPTRRTPDVRGVLWLDRATAELRSLDFTYTWLPHETRVDDFGGTVTFFRTLSGRWIIRSWRIRMPEFGYERWIERSNGERISLPPSRTPRVVRILEEGGAVPVGALLSQTGAVRGTVIIDTTSRRPVVGATVLLAGTTAEAVSDGNGNFSLTLVPPGSYTVVLRHPGLDSLGLEYLPTTVDVGTGTMADLRLVFPSLGELATKLCGGQSSLERSAVVRLIVVDSADRPLGNAPVVVSRKPAPSADTQTDSSVTIFTGSLDESGSYIACGVPHGAILRIESANNATAPWSSSAQVAAGVVGWHVVRVGRRN